MHTSCPLWHVWFLLVQCCEGHYQGQMCFTLILLKRHRSTIHYAAEIMYEELSVGKHYSAWDLLGMIGKKRKEKKCNFKLRVKRGLHPLWPLNWSWRFTSQTFLQTVITSSLEWVMQYEISLLYCSFWNLLSICAVFDGSFSTLVSDYLA